MNLGAGAVDDIEAERGGVGNRERFVLEFVVRIELYGIDRLGVVVLGGDVRDLSVGEWRAGIAGDWPLMVGLVKLQPTNSCEPRPLPAVTSKLPLSSVSSGELPLLMSPARPKRTLSRSIGLKPLYVIETWATLPANLGSIAAASGMNWSSGNFDRSNW